MTNTNRRTQWWVLLFKVNMKFPRLYPSKHARYTVGKYVYKSGILLITYYFTTYLI